MQANTMADQDHQSDDPSGMTHPEALGVIELGAVVRGYRVLDAMVKQAPVRVRGAYPVSSGKFLIFVDGSVAEVDEAMQAGLGVTGSHLVAKLFLSMAHDDVWHGVAAQLSPDEERPWRVPGITPEIDALGLLELTSVAETVKGADVALKAAHTRLAALHLARGIGGRAYFVLSGAQHDVEAAIEEAYLAVREETIIDHDVITAPHDDMTLSLLGLETVHPKY